MKLSTSQLAQAALLAALTLILSYIETLIPLPIAVPGIKLGLANITVLFALYLINGPTAVVLMLIKVVVSSLLFGSPITMLYSLAGSVLALLCMVLLKRTGKVSLVVISIVAAVCHNVGQLLVAAAMLHTTGIFVYLPVLLVAAVITGAITGSVAAGVIRALQPRMQRDAAHAAVKKPVPEPDEDQ